MVYGNFSLVMPLTQHMLCLITEGAPHDTEASNPRVLMQRNSTGMAVCVRETIFPSLSG